MYTTLKFYVREDGTDFSLSDMSEPESAAIGECVNDLIPNTFQYTPDYWIEAETCILDDDDDPSYGRLQCLSSTGPHPIPQELLTKLSGKTFRVYPRQLGLNPWGTTIEILFEAVPAPAPAPAPVPAPADLEDPIFHVARGPDAVGRGFAKPPKAGIKASDLIAAALRNH